MQQGRRWKENFGPGWQERALLGDGEGTVTEVTRGGGGQAVQQAAGAQNVRRRAIAATKCR